MNELENCLQTFNEEVKSVNTIPALEELRVAYLGKKGKVTELMGKIREIPNEQKREYGQKINQVKTEIEKLIPYSCSYFTVEQLKYLVRGGRVGKFSGIVGTILNIKPVLRVDENGKLVSYKKVISRKKSISELSSIVTQKISDKQYVMISHAECEEEAKELSKNLNETLGVKPIITDLTQVIGCHTGPGLLAVFFVGKEK